MGFPWITVLLLAASWTFVTSEYNETICKVVKESCGPVPPPIPKNFEARREIISYNHNELFLVETYFDFTNGRIKTVGLKDGYEEHLILDYKTRQAVEYKRLHPYDDIKKDPLSLVCTTSDIEQYSVDLVNPSTVDFMHSSNYALLFGGRYQFAYKGEEGMKERGIPVDKFEGCLYEKEYDSTMKVTYLFTSKKNLGVGTASGTKESDVTGIDNGFLSVPVKMHVIGDNEDSSFNFTHNFFWLKGDSDFKVGTFKIPAYMYCEGFRGRKNMTKFPKAFTTRVQRTQLSVDILGKVDTNEVTSFEYIAYYQEKKLARRDFTPGPVDTEIKSAFENMSPVRTIYDFSEGLLYTTNIASGRCYIRPITHNDYMEGGDVSNLYINMATPEHVFQMETDKMQHKGTDFTRDIECDVFAGLYKDEVLNATFVKETYISTNGWHELVDDKEEFGVPVKHSIIQKELDGELRENVVSLSFLKFKAKPPLLREFDVSNCIETQNLKDFAIFLRIPKETEDLIFQYKYQFLDAVQYYINDAAQLLSPLRVQRLQLRRLSQAKKIPVILFTLVDKIKLKVKVPVGQRGASLDEAVVFLQNFVDRNQFAMKFTPSYSKETLLISAFKGDLYVRKSSGELTYYEPHPETVPLPSGKAFVQDEADDEELMMYEDHAELMMYDDHADLNDVEEEGMSSGSLTLLSFAMIFIGIGIGVCIMYLYLRFKSESSLEDRIQLSEQNPALSLS